MDRARRRPRAGRGGGRRPAPWLLLAAAVAALAAAAGTTARATYGARTSGDEPQYLLSATSLAGDGDLDISDELRAEAHRPFHEVPLDPQTRPLDRSGRQVSPHDPLLPLLLAVPVAVAGWVGAKAALAALAGATAAATVWLAVRRFDVAPGVAAAVVAGAASGLPLAPYGSQVYPEVPAALVVVVVLYALTPGRLRPAHVVVAVAGLVALPWLSVKYAPVGAVLGVGLLARTRDRRWLQLASLASLALAGAAYLALHQRIYGGWTPYASGDHFAEAGELSVVGTRVDLVGRARRLAGLLVDRDFGIGPWAPLWFLAPAALGALARRRPPHAPLLLAALAAGWLNATFVALTMHGWWVPGRQLVVVLPLAALATAWFVDRHRALLPLSLAAGALGATSWLWLAAEASTGRRALIVDAAATAAPAYRLVRPLFPDGMRDGAGDVALLAAWSAVLVVLGVVGWRAGRAPGPSPPSPPAGAGRRGRVA